MWYNSSKDAENLSLTIKGLFSIGVLTTLVAVLKFAGVDLDVNDLGSLVESIGGFIVAIAGLVSAGMTIYGLVRKIYLRLRK